MKVKIFKYLILSICGLFLISGCNDVSQEKYSSIAECTLREMQKCGSDYCNEWAEEMCEETLKKMYTETFLKEQEARRVERLRLKKENEAKQEKYWNDLAIGKIKEWTVEKSGDGLRALTYEEAKTLCGIE